jgi:hypothetical protein
MHRKLPLPFNKQTQCSPVHSLNPTSAQARPTTTITTTKHCKHHLSILPCPFLPHNHIDLVPTTHPNNDPSNPKHPSRLQQHSPIHISHLMIIHRPNPPTENQRSTLQPTNCQLLQPHLSSTSHPPSNRVDRSGPSQHISLRSHTHQFS